MRFIVLFFSFLVYYPCIAQNNTDSLANYLEDQLYIAGYKINLIDTPSGFSNDGSSNGISFGFIKDIPLNEQRNIALGIGLGLAFNSFKNNLKLAENNQTISTLMINDAFTTNKITTQAIEFPIEFRWRTSTAEKFKFWRIYSGVKFTYLYKSEYSFVDTSSYYFIKNPEICQKLQYGLTLNAGYSAFNLYTYYGLKPLYKEQNLNQEKSSMQEIKFGLIIYIL